MPEELCLEHSSYHCDFSREEEEGASGNVPEAVEESGDTGTYVSTVRIAAFTLNALVFKGSL